MKFFPPKWNSFSWPGGSSSSSHGRVWDETSKIHQKIAKECTYPMPGQIFLIIFGWKNINNTSLKAKLNFMPQIKLNPVKIYVILDSQLISLEISYLIRYWVQSSDIPGSIDRLHGTGYQARRMLVLSEIFYISDPEEIGTKHVWSAVSKKTEQTFYKCCYWVCWWRN